MEVISDLPIHFRSIQFEASFLTTESFTSLVNNCSLLHFSPVCSTSGLNSVSWKRIYFSTSDME